MVNLNLHVPPPNKSCIIDFTFPSMTGSNSDRGSSRWQSEDEEFPSFHEHIKKKYIYIYIWKNSHGKLTGNGQKEYYTNKAVRKMHM